MPIDMPAEVARPKFHVCECRECGESLREFYTTGDYATEKESVSALLDVLAGVGGFDVYVEVRGHYMTSRTGSDLGHPRVDVFLRPHPTLKRQGWNLGAIAIECKRSHHKLGRPVSQMIDYRNAAFNVAGEDIVPRHVLLWPLHMPGGTVESIMAQQGLGGAWAENDGTFCMSFGGAQYAYVDTIGTLTLSKNVESVGNKRGSR